MNRRRGGFTLIEVLVALVIVAVGAAAVMSALTSAADSATHLRERSFASWIASNRIVETRLQTGAAPNGKREGEIDYAGARWAWREEILDTEVPGLRRIDVSVRRAGVPVAAGEEPDDWLVTLSGALGRDVARPTGSDPDWEPQSSKGPVPNPNNPSGPAGGPTPGSSGGGAAGSGTGGAPNPNAPPGFGPPSTAPAPPEAPPGGPVTPR